MMKNKDHKTATEIKEEPLYSNDTLTKIKCEGEEEEVTDFHNEYANYDEIEIKEETCWSEPELLSTAGPYFQNEEVASLRDEMVEETPFKLHMEPTCSKGDTTSSFTSTVSCKNTEECSVDPEVSCLLNSSQAQVQKSVQPETNSTLDPDMKSCNFDTLHSRNVCAKGCKIASKFIVNAIKHKGKAPRTCDICNKTFARAATLKEHKLIHEGKKPHKCETCKRSFTHVANLKRHKLTHEEIIRRYSCEVCKKSFTQKYTLKTHTLIHEGKRPYVCEVCNKSYIQASRLKSHKLIHEAIIPHKCDICDKSFLRSSNLSVHKSIHENMPPYKCDICDKSFTRSVNLIVLKLTHENKAPYKCDICEKNFVLLSTLKRHKVIHKDKKW